MEGQSIANRFCENLNGSMPLLDVSVVRPRGRHYRRGNDHHPREKV
jgi:hypothetical protein